ncbi:hypothetical protein [Vogesella sp. LIG4]|uniref:hypothetical protein n=1 Tax=Vogesella sp. LIG4 TaxID=1192162 RepID=UPI00081F8374|nr:hypothetical protein [Vogesella sp. LIG4]SCK15819.1 Predicted esterase of the alpha/beta hydrolase fold [Vogesella sp. LIG4]
MLSRLPLQLLADGGLADGRTLLALARGQGAFVLEALPALDVWLQAATSPFVLLAHGDFCLPALAAVDADSRCRAALLLSPQGDPLSARALPYPALVACHRPDPRYPRLTQAAGLAAAWQARLHLLSGSDDATELAPLLAELSRLASQPLAGEC